MSNSSNAGWYSCMITFISFVVFGFGIAAFSLYHFTFSDNYYSISGPGQVSVGNIANDFSVVLCENYEVSPFLPADVFMVKGEAKVNHHHKKISKRNTQQLEPESMYTQNDFYLLEGSLIHVNACKKNDYDPEETAEVLLFKGDESYTKWRKGHCKHCHIKQLKVNDFNLCRLGKVEMKYTVKERDTYYVALVRNNEYYDGFKADLKVSRTTFDTSHAIERCYMTNDCVFNLTLYEDVDIVVKFADDQAFSSFGSSCKFRKILWIGVFVLFPGVLISLALCCCCWLGGCQSKRVTGKRVPGFYSPSKASLVSNDLPPGYGSVKVNQYGNIQMP